MIQTLDSQAAIRQLTTANAQAPTAEHVFTWTLERLNKLPGVDRLAEPDARNELQRIADRDGAR